MKQKMLNKTNIRTKEKHQTIIKTSTQGFKQLLQLNIGTFTFTNETRLKFCLCSFIGKPGSPEDLKVLSKTSRSIYVRWSDPANNNSVNINNYTVHYRLSEEHYFKKNTSVLTYFNLTSLEPGKTYLIEVTALNRFYEGDRSSPIIETTSITGKFLHGILPCKV